MKKIIYSSLVVSVLLFGLSYSFSEYGIKVVEGKSMTQQLYDNGILK